MGHGDEFRRRVEDRLAATGQSRRAMSLQAKLSENTVHEMLAHPGRGIDPETVRGIARVCKWPEALAMGWAGVATAPSAEDPLGAIHTALYQGGWDEETANALYALAERTARTASDTSAAIETRLRPLVEKAIDQATGPLAASKGRLTTEEWRAVVMGDFLRYLAEEVAAGGGLETA
jgi:hypothetical protein